MTYHLRRPWTLHHLRTRSQKIRNQKTWLDGLVWKRYCSGVRVRVQGASTAERHGLENSNPAPGNSIELQVICWHAQIGFISSHFALEKRTISIASPFFQFSCPLDGIGIYRYSQGPHHGGDDLQAVCLLPADLALLLIDPPCAGNLNVAKSNVKKRRGRWRTRRIGLRPRRKTTPQKRLQMRKIFHLMYVDHIDICAITRRYSMGGCFLPCN